MTLIGLHGLAGSGKDTCANYLCNKYGFKKIAFADSLKQIVCIITGWPFKFVNGDIDREIRETLIHPVYGLTCRQLLQFVGTDLFRNQLNKEIWVNIVKMHIQNHPDENIVVTDCRFINEIKMVEELGGQIWIINRESYSNVNQHESEKKIKVDNATIINNNGSLNDLYQKIDNFFHVVKV